MKTSTNFSTSVGPDKKYSKKKILFPFAIFLFFGVYSYAQNSANLEFNPSTITVTQTQDFTISVRVHVNSGSLDAAAIFFNFDKTKLQVVSATNAPSSSILPTVSFALESPATMNSNGQVRYVAGTSSNFPTTDFEVISVTFKALQAGVTTLVFRRPPIGAPNANLTRSGSSILNSVTNGTITIQNISLPVSLLNLSATPTGKKATLNWATSSETNNRGFDVQRSNDGVNWTTIGFVAGAGNSSLVKNYTFADNNLETRRYYYRLKQIDIDEHSKYSIIVSAVIGGKGEYSLGQNYPNPFRNETTIQYTLPQAGQVKLSLFDVSGRAVKVLVSGSKEAGTHAISFNTGSLTRGIYYYRIQVGDFTDVKKLTIQ